MAAVDQKTPSKQKVKATDSRLLSTGVLPRDIVFLEEQHDLPELDPVLPHQSIATHL